MKTGLDSEMVIEGVVNDPQLQDADDFFFTPFEAVFDDEDEVVALHLDDLLPDDSGAVVLFAGEGQPVYLETLDMVVHSGISHEHVTASGVDVTGLHVYNFASGLTLYSESEVIIQTER
ncbi:hypothetical protein [Kiloniella laminariae]|uniref:hypothetical protein n=1 Tax=Kiloniella laminariae TaxID=454162 RepID=UPI00036F139A|nr:hypothetical protein [Kiloniella laminariae]